MAVDSTVPTPVLTRPLALGADLILHSATKYLNGHSDVVAGATVFGRMAREYDACARLRGMLGGVLGPFEASQLLRGLRTLHVRVRHQSAAAMTIAEHFADHAQITQLCIQGFVSRPMPWPPANAGRFGVCCRCGSGDRDRRIAALPACAWWKRATSLGGVRKLGRKSVSSREQAVLAHRRCDFHRLENIDDLIAISSKHE